MHRLIEHEHELPLETYLLERAHSGDILLFAGDSTVSCCISNTGPTRYSHTALILRAAAAAADDDMNDASESPELATARRSLVSHHTVVVESNPNDGTVRGFLFGNRNGPQMSDATQRLRSYEGRVCVRQMDRRGGDDAVNQAVLNYLARCRQKNVRYCNHLNYWLGTFLHQNTRDCPSGGLYCVNFVAYALCHAGLVRYGESPTSYANNLNFSDLASGLTPSRLATRYRDYVTELLL